MTQPAHEEGTSAAPAVAASPPRLSNRKKLAFSLLMLALLALLAEGALRLTGGDMYSFALAARRAHAYREWSRTDLRPDRAERLRMVRDDGTVIYDFTLATDALGLRSAERGGRPAAEHAGRPRAAVHCVGDSFTMGWGVEAAESWPSRLQERLGPQHLVLNEGVDGIGLLAARERFRAAARDYPPAAVLVQFIENDVGEDAAAERHRERWAIRHAWERFYAGARRRSMLLNLPFVLKWKAGLAPRMNRPLAEDRAEFGATPGLEEWLACAQAAARPDHATARALLELREECRAAGATLHVVLVQSNEESWAMARLCQDEGIGVVVVPVPYEERIPWDWHLNAVGNRRVADAVAEQVFGAAPQ